MPHLHELIDFVVGVFIVHDEKVLFVYHRALQRWLPIGGHIELDEDPEQALYREIQEECGLEVEILGTKPPAEYQTNHNKFLIPPTFLDIHSIKGNHRHTSLIYIAKARSSNAVLAQQEHEEIRWLSEDDFSKPKFGLDTSLQYYARQAIAMVRESIA